MVADGADETPAVRIPEMMCVRAHPVRALLEKHGRLARDFANVVSVFDVQEHDRLAEISQQCEFAVRCEGWVVPGTNAVEVLDIDLSFRPVEPEDAGASDQAVEIGAIQSVIDTKRLIRHNRSLKGE